MSSNDRSTLALRKAVCPYLAEHEAGDRILIAVSGGADSLALAVAIKLESKELALTLTVAILDHGLQDGSDKVAKKTAERIKKLGFTEILVRKIEVEIIDGLEASARRARYETLDQIALESGAKSIFLGHTKNDQAETVLLGLARGSGTRSLSGMADVNGRYIRPLLGISRSETEKCCVENGVEYWSDPHNSNHEFTRVKVRENILPLMELEIGPGITDALVRSAKILREDADALDQLATEFLSNHPAIAGFAIADLLALKKAIRSRVLRAGIYAAGAPSGSITADHLAPVEALVTDWHGQGEVSLPGGVKVARISGRLSLLPQH